MQLPAPETLADVIADGAIAQADASAAFAASIGEVSSAQFTHGETPAGQRTEVIVSSRQSGTRTFAARPVATITGGDWTWLHDVDFDIPELTGTQRAGDDVLSAARTLHGNAPALLVPGSTGATAVVIETDLPQAPPRTALITGLASLPAGVDTHRALLGFAADRGLGLSVTGGRYDFSDGTTVTLVDGRVTDVSGGMTLDDVRADAFYHSVEHQFFLEGVLPDARVSADPARGTATVSTADATLTTSATVLATVTGETWRWAWADRALRGTPGAAGALNLHRFGMDQGIPEFFTAELALAHARELKLHVAAKPVVHRWTHATVQLDEDTWAVLLLDDERLHLPEPSREAVAATLARPLPDGVDVRRAVASYARLRGLRVANADDAALVYVGGEPVSVPVD